MSETIEILHHYAFYGALIVMALLELGAPRRAQAVDLAIRWPTNFILLAGNIGLARVLLPISAMELATAGSFGIWDAKSAPVWLGIFVSILVLDLWKYVEHRLFHRFGLLWRLHSVHHGDTDVDFTTGERHHPLETLATFPGILALVWLLGLPAAGVAAFAVLASVVNLWSHANVRWLTGLEHMVRAVFVTPGMHVIHHSAERVETDSNFGIIFSFWDRLFGTYVLATPVRDAGRLLGLDYFRADDDLRVIPTLTMPFRTPRAPTAAPVASSGPAE